MEHIDIYKQAKKYSSIIESSADGVLLLESIRDEQQNIIDFRITHCNQVGCKLARFPQNALGKSLLQILPHLAGDNQYDLHKQVVETGIPVQFETTFRNEQGHEYGWFIVALQKVDDGVLSRFIDITEKKYYKDSLERQAELMNSILDASQHSIVALKAVRTSDGEIVDFTFLTVNDRFVKLLQTERKEIIGKSYLEFLKGLKQESMFDIKLNVLSSGEPYQGEVAFNFNGNDAWLNVSITCLGDDGVVQTIVDITDSKKDKDRLSKIINTSGAGIITLSPVRDDNEDIIDFRFGMMNKAFENFLVMDTSKFAAKKVEEIFSFFKGSALWTIFLETYTTGRPTSFEYHLEQGFDSYLNIRVDKMGDELLVTFVDQTELKKLQVSLQQSVIDLKRSNESLEDFTSAASHDLKEPIRKINILLSHLKSRHAAILEDDPFKTLEKLEVATKRMILLVDDLLEYSHLTHEVLKWEEIDLGEKINRIIEDLDMLIEEKKAVIKVGKLPVVYGHRRQMQQLFQNLLQNGLKYAKIDTPPEIEITAHTVQGASTGLDLPADKQEQWFHQIKVTDKGIGFRADQKEKIFNVFERLHGNHQFKGSGVGLAIAKKVVENHHGFIVAEGEPGVGATFTIYLPFSNDTVQADTP